MFYSNENIMGDHLILLTLAGERGTESFSVQARHEPRADPETIHTCM